MRSIVLLLVLSGLVLADCSGQISGYVPAVVGNTGGLVNVTISQVPGAGRTFVSIYPRTGVSTQESLDQATAYASQLSSKNQECDLLVDFGTKPETSLIDGPSAGTALTVMTYALIEGKTLRNDTIITGTIDRYGHVGPVGGLFEKAKGAASVGAKYFITPVEDFYEILILRDIEKQFGITILQAKNVSDVIGFMTENKPIEQSGLEVKNREIPELPLYDSSRISGIAPLANSTINDEETALNSITDDGNETEAIKAFFKNELIRQRKVLGEGYVFSAANEAFLNYIDLSTIKIILNNNLDLPRKKGDVGKCLTGITIPAMTDRNYEWIIGADLRQAWAYDKLNSVSGDDSLTSDEKVIQYNDLMYAQAWCNVAKGLVAAAPSGGKPLNESVWKELAQSKISEARAEGTTSQDTANKLQIAADSYNAGHYGAAIYDAVYVLENENPQDNATSDYSFESLWGNIYSSHAAYLSLQNETSAAATTLGYAMAIDRVDRQMKALVVQPAVSAPATSPEPQAQPDNSVPFAAAAILIFLLIAVAILLKSGKNGDNGTRPFKTYRAKQKES